MDGIITVGAITKETAKRNCDSHLERRRIQTAKVEVQHSKAEKWILGVIRWCRTSKRKKTAWKWYLWHKDSSRSYLGQEKRWNWSSSSSHSDQRGIIQKLASIYDPLVIASSVTLYGKIIYREACDLKNGCDKELLNQVVKKYYNCIKRLDAQIKVPRCIGMFK